MPAAHIVLASSSARRQTLLQQIGITFDVVVVDVDETPRTQENPHDYVKRLAEEKALAGFHKVKNHVPVLGADTTVVVDGCMLGKPRDAAHAVDMLMALSGKTHQVMTAVAMVNETKTLSLINVTDVSVGEISPAQALAYWQTGEPADKAGAYAIQGLAAVWIKKINGSFSGVMGLPLYETAQLLKAFNVSVWRN